MTNNDYPEYICWQCCNCYWTYNVLWFDWPII